MKKINKILLELYNDRKQLLFLSFLACVDLIINNFIPSNPNVIQATAAIATLVVVAVGTAYSIYSAETNRSAAEDIAEDAEKAQTVSKAELAEAKRKYEQLQFDNPYEDIENPYEDLTVNQQQAEFQTQQGAQRRADILQNLRSAAGMSGVAGLAQALANQGQLATQQISASIGQQEALNQKLAAKGAMEIEKLEGYGKKLEQDFELSKEATLLGMTLGDTAAANTAYQNALLNQQQVSAAADAQIAASLTGLATTALGTDYSGLGGIDLGGALPEDWGGNTYNPNVDYSNVSDRRLKKNINKIGKSPSGLNIYSFEYKNPIHGKGLFQGVMSDEVPKTVVTKKDGYDMVDYSKLDIEFKQI